MQTQMQAISTISIRKSDLVAALVEANHISAMPSQMVVGVSADGSARVFHAGGPSSHPDARYFNQMVGEALLPIDAFVDDGADLTWGEAGAGSGPDGEWTETDDEVARDFVEMNLAESVEFGGVAVPVRYEAD